MRVYRLKYRGKKGEWKHVGDVDEDKVRPAKLSELKPNKEVFKKTSEGFHIEKLSHLNDWSHIQDFVKNDLFFLLK